MHNDDEKEDGLPKRNLSTTYDEENDETEAPMGTDKPSPSAAAQIDTALPSTIYAVPISVTTDPVIPSARDPFRLSSISVPTKPPPVTTDYIHTTVDLFFR